jgi:hypothetical protein
MGRPAGGTNGTLVGTTIRNVKSARASELPPASLKEIELARTDRVASTVVSPAGRSTVPETAGSANEWLPEVEFP